MVRLICLFYVLPKGSFWEGGLFYGLFVEFGNDIYDFSIISIHVFGDICVSQMTALVIIQEIRKTPVNWY